MIQFARADIGTKEIEAVTRTMQSGWLAAGPQTEVFEKEFSLYITPKDVRPYYCIFTNSCTAALKMAYKFYLERGYKTYRLNDNNTFCATYAAAEEMGLKRLDYNGHPDNQVRVSIWYGGIKSPDEFCLIEDSAHRIEPNDPLVGKIRCYSFYVTKNMTTLGAGGMFVTDDKEVYEQARLYWKDGINKSTYERQHGGWDYKVEALAGGYDGSDVAAACGRVQLRRLPEFTKRRNEIRDRYNKNLGINWQGNHLMIYRTPKYRELLNYLPTEGIGVSYNYPGTGWNGVSLPIYPSLTNEEVDYVCDTIKEWNEKNRNK